MRKVWYYHIWIQNYLGFILLILTYIKFIYSEKATKFCEIFTLLLSYVVPVKSKVKISQNIVAFSEYMNFTTFLSVNVCFFLYVSKTVNNIYLHPIIMTTIA